MDDRVKALGYKTTQEFRAVGMMAFEMFLNAMEHPIVMIPKEPPKEALRHPSGA